MKITYLVAAVFLAAVLDAPAQGNQAQAAQNPSPMSESTRSHARVAQSATDGIRLSIAGLLPEPVEVFLPRPQVRSGRIDVLIHFHGPAFVVNRAVERLGKAMAAATVQLGSGSGVYSRAFDDPAVFFSLLEEIPSALGRQTGRNYTARRIILSAFSAGYGAVRRILGREAAYARVHSVLLLDGIHAGYVPPGKVLSEGGEVNREDYAVFLKLARDASDGDQQKSFLLTHSEVFPGTFASTTEVTECILRGVRLRRRPVLRWGPGGMQQLSFAGRGTFRVLGFAGNSAPDHLDHLHGMEHFLRELLRL